MIISRFRTETDNQPERVQTHWSQLVESLSNVLTTDCRLATCARGECPHKRTSAWSPASWPDGAIREKRTVDSVSCLVIDLDHIPPDELEGYVARLDTYAYVLHASHSDRPDDRCVRIVVQLSRPVPGADFTRFWEAATAHLDLPADRQTKDASHLYYLPSRPSDADGDVYDGSGFDYAVGEGLPLDVDTIMALAVTPATSSTPYEVPAFHGAPSRTSLDAAAQLLGQAWAPAGQRHHAQLALAGALTRLGWPVDLVGEFCAQVAEIAVPGKGDLPKRLTAARSSAEKFEAGEPILGWPTVAQHADPTVVEAAMRALGVPPPLRPDPEFAAAMTRAVQRMTAPSRLELRTAIERARERLRRGKSVEDKFASKLLARVLKGESLTDHADEDREKVLVQAAIAVVRVVPDHTPRELISELLLSPAGCLAGDVPGVVELALDHVRAHGRPETEAAEGDLPDPVDDDELRDQLELDKDGRARPSGHNVERVLRFAAELRAQLRFNVITKQIEVTYGRFVEETPSGLPVGIKNWLGSHWAMNMSTNEVAEQLLRVAQKWGAYNPVAEYLVALTWDRVPRVGSPDHPSWLTTYCHAEDTPYIRKVGARFLISACARAIDPGCKVDTVLVLEGEQGVGKSTTLGILGGEWFTDTPVILGDKDSRLLAASKWIVELGELKALLRDIDAAKGFLSQRYDDFRPPYGKAPEKFLRRCVFAGSTNEDEYLQDPSGNRRYWAARTGRCDTISLARDRDQLWAEALYRYRTAELHPDQADPACPGERWWFLEEEQREADEVIAQRCAEDPWIQMIQSWTANQMRQLGSQAPKTHFTISEIAEHALNISSADMSRYSSKISRALRIAGFKPGVVQRKRVWLFTTGASN